MPVTFHTNTKTKTKGKLKEQTAQAWVEKTELQAKVDRLGELEQELAHAKPLLKEYEAVKKALAAECADYPENQEVILDGIEYKAVFSACAETTNPPDLTVYAAAVSMEDLLATVKISVTDAKKYLPAPLFETLFEKVPGSRRFKAVVPT